MGRALVLIQAHVPPTKQNPPPPNGAELCAEPLAQAPQNRRGCLVDFLFSFMASARVAHKRSPSARGAFLYVYQGSGKREKHCGKLRIESSKRRWESVSRYQWFSFRFRVNLLIATKKEVRLGKENAKNHHTRQRGFRSCRADRGARVLRHVA